MKYTNRIKASLLITTFSLILAACGGGSGDSGSTPTPTPTPTPQPADPTITVTQENTTCEVSTECLVLTAQASKSATGASFSLNGIDVANVEVAGVRTEISSDGTVSFNSSDTFKLYVKHTVAETVTLGLSSFTVDGKSYSVDNSIDVEFIVPEANARLNMDTLECGTGTCNGKLLVDAPISEVNFTLDNNVAAIVETDDGTFTSQDGKITFPSSSNISISFSYEHSGNDVQVTQTQQATNNVLDSVVVSGVTQTVDEVFTLTFDRNENVYVRMYIPTIYGGALVTTDPEHEVQAIKQVRQYGPGIETHKETVLFESVSYTFLKWNMDTKSFDELYAGSIETATGLTQEEAKTLAFHADTTPWVYRVEVTGTLEGGDTLTDSKTFVKRDESMMFFVLLFPDNVSGERLAEVHAQYDDLEEGVEFSSTLANLYPREYMDEFGNINPSTCAYAAELMGMFPSVDTAANVEIKTLCNVDTPFSIGNIATETSMVLNISSQEHPDLTEVDFTLPADSISMPYEAKKGSNVVDWKFHSFAGPGSVEVLFSFPTNNTVGLDTLIEFDVSN